MLDAQWKLIDGSGQEAGPYSTADLQSFYQSGHIDHNSLVWAEGLTDWVKAGEIENLLPNLPQVIELAEATPVTDVSAPPALAGAGPGITPGAALPATQSKKAAGWLGGINFLTCLFALLLFFLPWLELSCAETGANSFAEMAMMGSMDSPGKKDGVKKEETPKLPSPLMVQSGFQSITGETSPSSELEEMQANEAAKRKKAGLKEEQTTNSFEKEFMEADGEKQHNAAIWVTLAFGLIIIALILSIFVFVNLNRAMLLACQIICVVAAAFIGIQMAAGFPVAGGGIATDEQAAIAKAMMENLFTVEYTIWLYCELLVLGSALIFLIIGRTAAGTQKPNPLLLQQQGQSPAAGGGLRFH